MLDLLCKHHESDMVFVYLYYFATTPSKDALLRWYERRYRITINRLPGPATRSIECGKKIRMADIEAELRQEHDISYIAQGVRRDESFARRGMLAKTVDGVDARNLKFYPVCDISAKEAMAYCKANKLPLPVEYSRGLKHEISEADGELLLWVKNNFPADYSALKTASPMVEAMTKRAQWYGGK
jgi:sulfate adenylyltransferase subunit 2